MTTTPDCIVCAQRPRLLLARRDWPVRAVQVGDFPEVHAHLACFSELEHAARGLAEDSYRDERGVYRWTTNDHVVPDDVLAYCSIDDDVRALCREVDDEETAAFLEQYRRAQAARTDDEISEQRAEARAAMGPGVSMVNVLTGERWTT